MTGPPSLSGVVAAPGVPGSVGSAAGAAVAPAPVTAAAARAPLHFGSLEGAARAAGASAAAAAAHAEGVSFAAAASKPAVPVSFNQRSTLLHTSAITQGATTAPTKVRTHARTYAWHALQCAVRRHHLCG